jgi:hypothetical protein
MERKRESALHYELKFQYAGIDGKTEVNIKACGIDENYICDGVTGTGEIIEIQTGSFAPLKEKVKNLSLEHKIRIVHPVILHKYIDLFDKNGVIIHSRKSPVSGGKWDLFKVLIYGWEIAASDNVCIELAFVDIVEKRLNDGLGSWRRKGVSIVGKSITARYPPLVLRGKADYVQFAPFERDARWTTADLSRRAKISSSLAGKTLFALTKLGVVERTGKKGRAWVYAFPAGFDGL